MPEGIGYGKKAKEKTKKKKMSKKRAAVVGALEGISKAEFKEPEMKVVAMSPLGSAKLGAMKKSSDIAYRASKKKLRANKRNNDREYRKNN